MIVILLIIWHSQLIWHSSKGRGGERNSLWHYTNHLTLVLVWHPLYEWWPWTCTIHYFRMCILAIPWTRGAVWHIQCPVKHASLKGGSFWHRLWKCLGDLCFHSYSTTLHSYSAAFLWYNRQRFTFSKCVSVDINASSTVSLTYIYCMQTPF